MKTAGWIVVGVAAVVTGVCGVMAFGVLGAVSEPGQSAGIYGAPTGETATEEEGKPGVGPGVYIIGVDVPAGKYKSEGPTSREMSMCYWDTSTDNGGEKRILTQGLLTNYGAQGSVTLVSGQIFETSGCENWVKR